MPLSHPESDPIPGQVSVRPPVGRRPSMVGGLVVVVMILLGVIAGCFTVWYWTTQVRFVDSDKSSTTEGAPTAPARKTP